MRGLSELGAARAAATRGRDGAATGGRQGAFGALEDHQAGCSV